MADIENLDLEATNPIDDEVCLYDVLSQSATEGTAYHYYEMVGDGLFEEMYYLLELSHRQNANPEQVIALCREIVQERNKEILRKFDEKTDNSETINIDELSYKNTNLSLEPVCIEEAKQ